MRLPVILGIAGVMLGALGFKYLQNAPDLSTPKATILSLLDAYVRRDIAGIGNCVDGAVTINFPKELLSGEMRISAAKGKDIIVEINGDSARVAVEYEATIANVPESPSAVITFVDMLNLKKVAPGWLVVPGKLGGDSSGALPLISRPLSLLAAVVGPDPGYRNAILNAQKAAAATSCLSNTKQIALGITMYVQDYDERMPRSAAGYQSMIMPYIKSDEVFRCALDAKGTISYSMNVSLQNRSLAEVANPVHTVLLYEGHNGVVDYRHDGRAAIAFVDGHAKLMTETETKSLIWKLPPPAPKKASTKKHTGNRH